MVGSLAALLPLRAPTKRALLMTITSRASQALLFFLAIKVTVDNPRGLVFTGRDRLLIVPNHISYLDVVVLSAALRAVFVTSRDIEQTPVLGHLCRAGGCMFIERRHRRSVLKDIAGLTVALNDGYNVVIFPEGTTSVGDSLLPFKGTLLESAVRSRCRVLPVCVAYERLDGQPLEGPRRDVVAWYGEMRFFPHLLRLMRMRSLDVRLSLLDFIPVREHKSRKLIARSARDRIGEQYHREA